jgi:hypothetical protein
MAIQLVNVGAAPDDGLGDPIRTAYIKINNNFLELVAQPIGGIVPNVYYVAKNGSDLNAGNALGQAFLTIKRAVQVATAYLQNNPTQRVCIFVKAGEYIEDNPIVCPRNLTIWGDNLRSVSVRPINISQDIFHVQNGDYLSGMTFRGHVSPAAAVAFPIGGAGLITTSPYVQNCSSITTTGTGMRIDGDLALGLKSMVTDSYTQVNEGGIGIHIKNQGYAQLVSIFTICTEFGVLVESGGYCSITNSNSSFGTFGLVADGVVSLGLSGFVDGANQIGQNIVIGGLSERPTTRQSLSFDGGVTFADVWASTPLVGGQSVVTISNPINVALPSGTAVSFYIRSAINASSHTFEWVGTGNNLTTALPQLGAQPIPANEVVELNGGSVVYTSTDQRGDFKIGNELTINGATGTITGETFDKSLFAVLTPYVLAIEG